MNKASIATIIGTAILAIAKKGSKSSTVKPLFSLAGTDKVTIHFSFNYQPFWIYDGSENYLYADLDEAIAEVVDFLTDSANSWKWWLQEDYIETGTDEYIRRDEEFEDFPEQYDTDDIWQLWLNEQDVMWEDEYLNEYMGFESLEVIGSILKNLQFSLKMPSDASRYDLEAMTREDYVNEAKSTIDNHNVLEPGFLDENDEWEYSWVHDLKAVLLRLKYLGSIDFKDIPGVFISPYEHHSYTTISEDVFNEKIVPVISGEKELLKDFIEQFEYEIFPLNDWWESHGDWYHTTDHGYCWGTAEITINQSTYPFLFEKYSLKTIKNIIELVMEWAYRHLKYQHSRSIVTRDLDNDISNFEISKTEPTFPLLKEIPTQQLRRR